ncbi:hypothetical protein IC582_018997 [Cucumis melo]
MAGKGEGPAIGIDLGTKYSCGMEMAEMEMEMEERSFVVSSDPHQVHAIMGKNGSGKCTFAKIIEVISG